MSKINAVCVYCGSSAGTEPAFGEAAGRLGRIFAENGVRLIYGGGSVGLMGILADAVLAHGGKATGIIPDFLTQRERFCRFARRYRHAGGIGRTAHLGPARPALQADLDRKYRRLLGPATDPGGPYA